MIKLMVLYVLSLLTGCAILNPHMCKENRIWVRNDDTWIVTKIYCNPHTIDNFHIRDNPHTTIKQSTYH